MPLLRRGRGIITPRRDDPAILIRAAGLVALALVLAGGSSAVAQADQGSGSGGRLWATVNACDTVAHPDTIGIRASMPGTASGHEAMFMRFRAQYQSSEDGKWHNVPGGDSGFLAVGHADVKARQKGRYVEVKPTTDSIVLRGIVTFQWRRGDNVVRRARQRTHKGHRSEAGDDPPGYSATNCTITR